MSEAILLTRSPAQNTAMAPKIRAAFPGAAIISLPLLEAQPVPMDQAAKELVLSLDRFDLIIFISRNSVLFGLPSLEQYWPAWPMALRWYAVGPATATSLLNFDIHARWPSLATSEGLLLELADEDMAGKQILIVRGVGGRETLRDGLVTRGATITYLEAYRRVPLDYDLCSIDTIPNGTVSMIYSGEALTRLAALLGQRTGDLTVVVPSQRLEVMATALGFGKVHSASSQQDQAMLDALKDQYLE